MELTLAAIAGMLCAARDIDSHQVAAGYSIDSRTIRPGELFFAIAGPDRDGHEYVTAAVERGAVGAVVRRDWDADAKARQAVLFRVDDPAEALAKLATLARLSWGRPALGVTGSNGKTSTKEIAAALLATRYRVAKTEGNLNNELGLPLSILRMPDDADLAVLEMGMNHAGEIRRLARIAKPTVGLVTNVSAAHVGAFASLDEVAAAKRELIEELGPTGTAVLNADDERVRGFAAVHSGRCLTFGESQDADFRAVEIETGPDGSRFSLRRGEGPAIDFKTLLPGRHNVMNTLAGLAAVSTFGLAAEDLREVVAGLRPVAMRGRVVDCGGLRILDDCYNSNPAAVAAMLQLLASTAASRRVAVLGEMRELGAASAELHREAGRRVAEANVDLLAAVAGDARILAEGAIAAGLSPAKVYFFDDAEQAGDALTALLRAGDAVLFKGSRGVGLERALARVAAIFEPQAATG